MGRFIGRDPIEYEARDSNLYRYVKNKLTRATDPEGLEKYELDHDARSDCPCPCVDDPADCEITIQFLALGDVVEIYEFNNGKRVLTETRRYPWLSKTNRKLFHEQFPIIIMLKSKSKKDVRSCHLHQNMFDYWVKYSNGDPENDPRPKDYDSIGQANNKTYGGYWIHDSPRFKSLGRAVDFFFQAEVTVEENPAVKMYWGGHANVQWPQKGEYHRPKVKRKVWGPDAKKTDHPFSKDKK